MTIAAQIVPPDWREREIVLRLTVKLERSDLHWIDEGKLSWSERQCGDGERITGIPLEIIQDQFKAIHIGDGYIRLWIVITSSYK